MAMTVIRRLGVVSVAKVQGILYAVIGLIVGGFFSLFALFGAALGAGMNHDTTSSMFSAALGIGAIIIFPIFYGILGFVGGLILAAVYNMVAGMAGGIEIELG